MAITQNYEQILFDEGLPLRVQVERLDHFRLHWHYHPELLFVVSGELITELKDGRRFVLTAGMSYQVSDFGDHPHRSSTEIGATLFIVD